MVERRSIGCPEVAPGGEASTPARLSEQRLRVLVERFLRPGEVYLFGSRARGDAVPGSDFDLAWQPGGGADAFGAVRFREAAEEDARIVHTVDLVDLREAGPALRAEIHRTGVRW